MTIPCRNEKNVKVIQKLCTWAFDNIQNSLLSSRFYNYDQFESLRNVIMQKITQYEMIFTMCFESSIFKFWMMFCLLIVLNMKAWYWLWTIWIFWKKHVVFSNKTKLYGNSRDNTKCFNDKLRLVAIRCFTPNWSNYNRHTCSTFVLPLWVDLGVQMWFSNHDNGRQLKHCRVM